MLKKLLFIFLFIKIIKLYNKNPNKNLINIKGQMKNLNLSFFSNNKKNISWKTFKNYYILLFFGYTSCPNICPKIIENISNKIKILKNFYKIKFIFISINWKYENSELIQKYLNKIKLKNTIGVYFTGKLIEKLTNNLRIIYKYNKNKIIKHSIILFVVNKIYDINFMEINKKKLNFLKNIVNI